MDEDLRSWCKSWKWPWEDKKSTAQEKLIGLGRMQDRLKRKYVWVYQGPEKHQPIIR
jgi:hypothetical protein